RACALRSVCRDILGLICPWAGSADPTTTAKAAARRSVEMQCARFLEHISDGPSESILAVIAVGNWIDAKFTSVDRSRQVRNFSKRVVEHIVELEDHAWRRSYVQTERRT